MDLVDRTPLVHSAAGYTSNKGCTTLVAPVAMDPENRNQLIAIDLRFDPSTIVGLDVEELRRRVFTKKAELDEERVPLTRIRLNRCPFLAPMSTMSDDAAARLGIDKAECLEHLRLIKREGELLQKMVAVFEMRDPPVEIDDPELRLYSGSFFSDDDRAALDKAHERIAGEGAAAAKAALYRLKFDDDRPAQLLRRLYARNFPETMGAAEKAKWRSFCAGRLQLPPLPGATDLAGYGKVVNQRLEKSRHSRAGAGPPPRAPRLQDRARGGGLGLRRRKRGEAGMRKAGFIGYGRMGSVLLNGLIEGRGLEPSEVVVSTRTMGSLDSLRARYPELEIAEDNPTVARKSALVFVCVGTSRVHAVLTEILDELREDSRLVFISGGLEIASVEEAFKGAVTKIIPTLLAEVREGITLVCHNSRVLPGAAERLEAMLLRRAAFAGTARLLRKSREGFRGLVSRVATAGGATEGGAGEQERCLPEAFDRMFSAIEARYEARKEATRRRFIRGRTS